MDELRIGDKEREKAVGVLSEQYALGRITQDEFGERSDVAWSAKTRGDLLPLFADLPVGPAGEGTAGPIPGPRVRPPAAPAWRGAGRYVGPVLVVLLVLTVVTHLPVFLIAVGIFLFLRHRGGWGHRGWGPRGPRHGYQGSPHQR